MKLRHNLSRLYKLLILFFFSISLTTYASLATERLAASSGNFGLPGIIDLPTAKRFPDGELIITQQIHKSLARSGISFQALPKLSFSFRYSGHGHNGTEANGRINHDRSFDVHLSILDEGKYFPALSMGLRDFIGTGWYSSEYIVGTKSIKNLELTAGLGFGRLAGRNPFSNPFKGLSSKFINRTTNKVGRGGTLGTINWFQGDASVFYGLNYKLGQKVRFSAEYTPDIMYMERPYISIESPWNYGISYVLNDYLQLSMQYLHGSQTSITANLYINPKRPPMKGGKELAPVPMRDRNSISFPVNQNNQDTIRKVLKVDKFEVRKLQFFDDEVKIDVVNTKFRSSAQALGRITSTLQRFTSDKIKTATISFYRRDLMVASYQIKLEEIAGNQFNSTSSEKLHDVVKPLDLLPSTALTFNKRLSWGVGPYFAHRLFNPDLPLSVETGIELDSSYRITSGLKISGSIRKSILTNFTDNKRRSNSVLPHVHTDWPLYDIEGQKGHIHALNLSYVKNVVPSVYFRAQAGYLEPFFAGIGGEILFKPINSPLAIGLDMHRVRKRAFDMKFDLLDYQTTVGHLSLYYDAGGMFDVEINAGRYLAKDWGITTIISRKFGTGWEVGGYATFTDVPFATFGEGSFDKAIYVSMPIDWILSTPNRAKRRLTLRPITRDGGANLRSSRKLYRYIEDLQPAQIKREIGRLWK